MSDFIHKFNLKNQAASIIKNYQIISSLSLNDVEIIFKDGAVSTSNGIVILHPAKATHSVAYINQNCHEVSNPFCGHYFDSYGGPPPEKLLEFILN